MPPVILFALRLVATALAAYKVHQVCNNMHMDAFPDGWRELSSGTVGILFAAPCLVSVHDDLRDESSARRLVVAHFMTWMAWGIGTALGYLHDSLEGEIPP